MTWVGVMPVLEAILETYKGVVVSVGSDSDLCWKWRSWTYLWVEERTRKLGVGSYDPYGCAAQWLVGHEMNVLFLVEVKKLMLG